MVNFGYPYNDIVICKDSTDYLDILHQILPGELCCLNSDCKSPAAVNKTHIMLNFLTLNFMPHIDPQSKRASSKD